MNSIESGQARKYFTVSQQEGEHFESSANKILERLSPEIIEDGEGIQRPVYTFTDAYGNRVKVLFYSPEEMPLAGTVKDKYVSLFGDASRWRDSKQWDTYVEDLGSQVENRATLLNPSVIDARTKDEERVFIVESRPDKLVAAALSLGVDDEKLRDLYQQLKHHKISAEAAEMVDQVIAGKALDDNGNFKLKTDYEGEALLLLALQGDTASKEILEKKRAQLDKLAEAAHLTELDQFRAKAGDLGKVEPLDPHTLVAVHLTKYMPAKSKTDNEWQIQTTFDATNWQFPRSTIHTSLNHSVEPAGFGYGSWEDTPIAVISPLEKVIEANGKPAVLNTVDTVFEVSPGQRLHIPQDGSILVRPGKPKAAIYETQGNEVIYATDITPEVIKNLDATLTNSERDRMNADLRDALYGVFSKYNANEVKHYLTIPEDKFEGLIEKVGVFTGSATPVSYGGKTYLSVPEYKDLLPSLSQESVSVWVKNILAENDIQADTNVISSITRRIESIVVRFIKKRAIKDTIENMGFQVQPGGDWAWGGSWAVDKQTQALAMEMGVRYGAHSNDKTGGLEEGASRTLSELASGNLSIKDYRSRVTGLPNGRLSDMSPAQRRMMYLVGAL